MKSVETLARPRCLVLRIVPCCLPQPKMHSIIARHDCDMPSPLLLRGIAERGALAPLFVVATSRPEFRAPWGTRSHHSTISLAPLDRAQVRDMVAELSARHALPRDVA